jgi:hypothetical protein
LLFIDVLGLEELQSSIAKFKEKKASKTDKKSKVSKIKLSKNHYEVNDDEEDKDEKKTAAQLLSFDQDLLTGGKFIKPGLGPNNENT